MLPKVIENLIEEFARLPGVGRKTAERFAIYTIRQPAYRQQSFGKSIADISTNLSHCHTCWSWTESGQNKCNICSDTSRDHSQICVVEDIMSGIAIEKSGAYKGVYHILHGVISPMRGIGVDELRLTELLDRAKKNIDEVIVALDPNIEGDTTALYIASHLPASVRKTKLGMGLSAGASIEWADYKTIKQSLEGRGLV